MYSSAITDIWKHAQVRVCALLCTRINSSSSVTVSASLVVDEWLAGQKALEKLQVRRPYNVFTTQTDSYTTAYYWPSKPSTLHRELEELHSGPIADGERHTSQPPRMWDVSGGECGDENKRWEEIAMKYIWKNGLSALCVSLSVVPFSLWFHKEPEQKKKKKKVPRTLCSYTVVVYVCAQEEQESEMRMSEVHWDAVFLN